MVEVATISSPSSPGMALYTFIMEYRGGTYISQVTAASVDAAILPWANQLPVDEIAHFGPRLSTVINAVKTDTR